jgi:lysophospholipase L1-like esterase
MSAVTPAPTIVYHGDSITANQNGYDQLQSAGLQSNLSNYSYSPRGFATWAQAGSGHRLRQIGNTGISGDTTSGILARIITDVLPLKPGWVSLLMGTNNMGISRAMLDQAKRDTLAAWDLLDRAGIRVIAGTLPPAGTYSGKQQLRYDLENFNDFLRVQAQSRPNLILVDYHAAVVWPSAGTYQVGFNMDATHPNEMGAFAMGTALANVINQIVPPRIVLSDAEGDSRNLLANGRFTGAGAGAVPTGWSTPNLTAGAFSKTARTDMLNGSQWQTVTVANGTNGTVQANMNVDGLKLAIGDTIDAHIEYSISGLDPAPAGQSQGFTAYLLSYNGSTSTALAHAMYWINGSTPNMPSNPRSGILKVPPVTVPAGATTMLFQVIMGGGGTYNLDRATIRNLSRPADYATT